MQSPQKIVPSPRKFTEDPLCDVQEPSERSRHTCGTSLESSMLNLSLIHMRSFGAGSGPEAMNHGNGAPGAAAPPVARPKDTARPKRFHGSITLDATRVGRDASRVADEVIAHLAGLVGSSVKVTLEIEADVPGGTPDNIVRTVTENSRTLKFDSHGFEVE